MPEEVRFPGAVRSFPHPCGGRIVPKNREEARKRFVHQQNGVPCGVFLHTFLHRLWKSFALLCGKWERERGLAPGWLASPCRCCPRRGAWRFWSPVDSAAVVPEGVVCLLCRLPTLPLACFPAPYPPAPLPRRGRGRLKVYFAGGGAPGTPALNHLRHLQNPPSKCPAEESLLGVADCPRRRPRRGGLPSLSPADHAVSLPFRPHPPDPLPAGKGEIFCFLMQGASPLASPGLNPGGTGAGGVSRAGGGACPASLARRALAAPG